MQALDKGRALFLVTTSTSPSLQAYVELHALSPLRESMSPWCHTVTCCVLCRGGELVSTDTTNGWTLQSYSETYVATVCTPREPTDWLH